MTPDPQTTLASDGASDAVGKDDEGQVEVDELLVEEVSIDGLCGVY